MFLAELWKRVGGAGASRLSAGEEYAIELFAEKHGITADQARKIIDRAGGSRSKADELAAKQKAD
jgi:hypothetical protein